MKKYLPFLICMIFLSQSCLMGQNSRQVYQNDKIDPKVKAELATLTKAVYKDMSENNFPALSTKFSDSLKTILSDGFAQKFMPSMQGILKGRTYRTFDEFYIKGIKRGDTIVVTGGKGDDAYTLLPMDWTTESYITMLVAGDSVNEVMLTLVYGKHKGKWLLSSVMGEDYSLKNKNAIALYHYAQKLEQQGYMIDAINIMGMATHCLRPGGPGFRFKKEKEVLQYSDTLTNRSKIKYPFPYTVNEVATKPSVVNIHYERDSTIFVPMIIYQTIVNMADTGGLKKENAAIQQNIGKIFTGMDKVNKRLFYRAYNVLPDGQNDPKYYGYVQEL